MRVERFTVRQTFPGEATPWRKAQRAASVLLGLLFAVFFITTPLQGEDQAWLTLGGVAMFLIINRNPSRLAGIALAAISIMVTSRYLFWRATETLGFETALQTILGLGLFAAELFAGLLMALSYVQTVYPLNRKPVPLPADPEEWPTVDVYVPSYNESLDLVRPTVLAAMNMDYPREKLSVWILDDGRRPEFREFAEQAGCGYIIRPDNKGAKAGNLNHALQHTTGQYIAIFDCDHAPTRAFLQMTLGWLERDKRIGMVQTPHYFYSPDPFERNLVRQHQVPNEGLLFYGVIQPGNDLWNAAFFCGSCAVLRREALEEVGGVPHTTVTEDCHCSLKMQQRGWHTAYIRIPLAAGLATERLALHIGQRLRWARGMLQIMRVENTPLAENLSWPQRFCYFIAGFGFLFALPRIVFLTSPLAFLFFGVSVIAASPLAIAAYAGSHIIHAIATTARLNGPHRHSFWSEIYEASLAVPLTPVTVLTLLDPSKGKFNVTDKGGILESGYLDFRAVLPNLIMLGLMTIGVVIGIWGISVHEWGTIESNAYLLNTVWAAQCLISLSASVAVGREREQSRTRARVEADLPAYVVLPNGDRLEAHSANLSLSGARMVLAGAVGVAEGDHVTVAFETGDEVLTLKAEVIRWEGQEAYLQFVIEKIADEAAIVRAFFGRPDAWLHWDHFPKDRPLRSLANVLACTRDAVFRKYRFGLLRPAARPIAAAPAAQAPRVSDVVAPRRLPAARVKEVAALLLAAGLAFAAPAAAQTPAAPAMSPPAAAPTADALPPGARIVTRNLRELGITGPMQLRGISDLQGVVFGLRADEVVTQARINISGASSPALIPNLSQIAITLNDQPVGTIPMDPARQSFGPLEFPLDPLYFSEINRLNFRFSGRYAVECNDPLSGLLWATITDLSTVELRIERLPPQRDLARLPEPIFDRRVLRTAATIPAVLPEALGPQGLRAAAIVASWFAVQADYRGATFPVSRAVPEQGDAIVIAAGVDAVPGLALPRIDGPTLSLVANPSDPFGTLLVIAGRSEAEAVTAAQALVAGRGTLSGETARVVPPTLAAREPYDAPRWIRTDRPVQIGSLIPREELTSEGYSPGAIRVPLRTAPDILTWRHRGFPVSLRYRSPPGPVVDVSTSRLDVSVSDVYLRSFRLADPEYFPLLSSAAEWVWDRIGLQTGFRSGRAIIPSYLVQGRDELQLRFDMRPMARGECVAVPAELRATIDPDSTVDLRRAHRYARLPNLGYFASSGFPFTRLADLSNTAFVLPERPSTVELTSFLDLVGQMAAIVGLPATGVQVASPGAVPTVAGKDLIVMGALGRNPALPGLVRESPVKLEGNRVTLALPDMLQDVRGLFVSVPAASEVTRASAYLADHTGEGFAALLGAQSPLDSSRSIVAFTGATPVAVQRLVASLRDPELAPRIQGDVAILSEGRMSGFRVGTTYGVGRLPLWLAPQVWLDARPERLLILLGAAGFLIGAPIFWILRRRALSRLRARMRT
ncbi:UDP-forming cellulose synthase catalytic subunit [Roseococcus sp. YIM B11640]|uniref:UDP-forming cellulose synthase catalytic subunit n=1 Tax=Roseococcus sp. YIM B11640 TaxID=3133973 RepID=UPI003C7EC677